MSDPTEEYAAIAKRMKELALERDRPFALPLAPTWEAELNEKLKPKPVPVEQVEQGPDLGDFSYYGY